MEGQERENESKLFAKLHRFGACVVSINHQSNLIFLWMINVLLKVLETV